VALGTVEFAEALRQRALGNPREQKPLRAPTRAASWEQIVAALEQIKGESWNEFAQRHGDWGRDAALWLGRCAGRLRLAELGGLAGNLDYAVVSKAIARFEKRLRTDPQMREQLASVQLRLFK
jgi:hypothetical protein